MKSGEYFFNPFSSSGKFISSEEQTSVEINNLLFGQWLVTVEALNEDNVSIAGGQNYAEVISGQTTNCSIYVTPFEGTGYLDLDITWQAGAVQNPVLTITLERKGYDPFEVDYTLAQNQLSASVYEELDSGYYTLTARLYDDTGPIQEYYGGKAEVVRILQGETAYGEISIGQGTDPDNTTNIEELEEPSFPSPGAPVGSDAVSASTNQSSKGGETSPNLNPLAGAMYIAAPKINKYGTVELGYPLDVPKGRAGMNPAISLAYSSSSGDGIVGTGWNINTGLGSISRSTRYGQLYYDHRDIFTFNGQRLVKIEGPAESEIGIYRMEIESGFARFELVDKGNGKEWYVYDKTGCVTIYGEDNSSRIYHPDNQGWIFAWSYARSYDLSGNYMYAVYDTSSFEEKHVLYLKEIRYTGNYNTNTTPAQFVRFHYKNRNDYYVTKAAGFITKIDRILDRVDVGWDDPTGGIWGGTETVLWTYSLLYEISEDTNRPYLKTVNSDRQTTTPEFFYQKAEHYFTWERFTNPYFNKNNIDPQKVKYFSGDFNGDGMMDVVFFDPDTGYWSAVEPHREGGYTFPRYSSNTMFKGYDTEEEIQFFKKGASGDFNGDGRCDIAFYLPRTKEIYVAEHNGTGFEFIKYGEINIPGIDIFKCEWFHGDFDGNSLSDVILFNEPTGEWILMANMGDGFEFIKVDERFKNIYRDDFTPNENMSSPDTLDSTKHGRHKEKVRFFSGDYNGDGRVDISMYDERDGRWWVAENRRIPGSMENSGLNFQLDWSIYKVFSPGEQVLFSNQSFQGDFNGDGFSDFLLFDREKGEWILGATLDGTIEFSVFSRAPQFKEITKWLQGDFNGDGRTDIGFYSVTDDKFWIGEAEPDGFRYSIYNSLVNGPDPDRVMRSPLPKDQIMPAEEKAIITDEAAQASWLVSYKYDDNYHALKGEKVFAGNFTGKPGMLIYRKNTAGDLNEGWAFQESGSTGAPLNVDNELAEFNPEDENNIILKKGAQFIYEQGRDGILYYNRTAASHTFKIVHYTDSLGWENGTIGSFSTENVPDFDIGKGLYLVDDFNENGKKDTVIVFKPSPDESGEPQFLTGGNTDALDIYYKEYPYPEEVISRDSEDIPEGFKTVFYNNSYEQGAAEFIAGGFEIGPETEGRILMTHFNPDEGVYKWYLGSADFNAGKIVFEKIEGDAEFIFAGNKKRYRIQNNEIIYDTEQDGRTAFHRIYFDNAEIKSEDFAPLDSGITFKGEYDYLGNPIVYDGTGIKYFDLQAEQAKEINTSSAGLDPYIEKTDINRDDLIDNYYPYNWIQGDFNGDNKTDIGIFHLGEDNFYFANTEGTVPGLMTEVHNGIGGTYNMSYINSTSLDNTGTDDIPDLPQNMKLCNRLTVSDGRGNEIATTYKYRDGYLFSRFIDGKKEADFYGFGEFEVISATGGRTISRFHTTTFSDYRKNRALAGALKETITIGSDNVEYSRVENSYKIHEIVPPGFTEPASFLIEPVLVKTFTRGVLTRTTISNISLSPGEYAMQSKEGTTTDHFGSRPEDDEYVVHSPASVTSRVEFENIADTNEMRTLRKISFLGTEYENTTKYEYDGRGNLTRRVTEYTGTGLDPVPDGIMEYEYDTFGNLVKTINAGGSPVRNVERSYSDESGLYQFVTAKKVNNGTQDIISAYKVNYGIAFGSIDEITDPNGNRTYYDYDNYGRMIRQKADTNFGDRRIFTEYVYSTGFPMSAKVIQYTGTTDAPIEARVFVDGMGRTIHSVTSAGPNKLGRKYVKSGMLIYDSVGRVIRKSQTDWALDDEIDVYRPNTKEKYPTRYEYDPSGRVKKTVAPAAYPGEPETSTIYTYNDPYEVITTHSIGRSKRVVSNGRGHVLYVEEWGTGDDGELTTAKIGFAYDIAGNRVKKMDLSPLNPPEGDFISMDLMVDETLFQQGEKDDSGYNIAQWKYDGFGRVIEGSDPDLGYSAVQYNNFGDVVSSTDALGRTTTMEYDLLGRLVKKTLPGDEGEVNYIYDERAGSQNALGRLVEVDDPVQRKIFSYDELGRIKREIREIKDPASGEPVSSGTFETSFEYDLLDRTRSIYYPEDPKSGVSITAKYKYSAMGVTGVEFYNNTGKKDIVKSILYNEFGQMENVTRGNDTTTEYFYDIKGRLSNLITTDSELRRIQDVRYTFRIDGTIESTINTPDLSFDGSYESTVNYNYQYDGLSRLINAEGYYKKVNSTTQQTVLERRYEQGFTFAPNGNMLSKSTSKELHTDTTDETEQDAWTYNYANNNHAATSIDSQNYGTERFLMTYDEAGNLVCHRDNEKDITKSMEYDSYNRIRRVTDEVGDLVGQYWYDNQGFRVRKMAKREILGDDRLVEVLYPSMYFGIEKHRTAQGDPIEDTDYAVNNIYLNGVRVAAVIPSGDARYYLTDQVDSVKVVLDDDGHPVANIEYLPYGETWFQEGEESHNPKYNSQELDKETGYYFYNARHYDAEISRFVTPDTVIDGVYSTQGWNRYSYVQNNPVVGKDPTGHFVTFSVSKDGISVGVNNGAVGVGINLGFGSDPSVGAYVEVGPHIGPGGSYVQVGVDYHFKSKEFVGYTSATCGMSNGVGVNATSRYNLTKNEYMGTSIGARIGLGNSGLSLGVTMNFDRDWKYQGFSATVGAGVPNTTANAGVGLVFDKNGRVVEPTFSAGLRLESGDESGRVENAPEAEGDGASGGTSEGGTADNTPTLYAHSVITGNYESEKWGKGMTGYTELKWVENGKTLTTKVDFIKWAEKGGSYEYPTQPGTYSITKSPDGARKPIAINSTHEGAIRYHGGWISEGCIVYGRDKVGVQIEDIILSNLKTNVQMNAVLTVTDNRSAADIKARPLPY